MRFTEAELELMKSYSTMSSNTASSANRWAVEIVPPALLVILGIVMNSITYPIAGVLVLVSFNIARLRKQRLIALHLKSISEKVLKSELE